MSAERAARTRRRADHTSVPAVSRSFGDGRNITAVRISLQMRKAPALGGEPKCSGTAAIEVAGVAVLVTGFANVSRVQIQGLAGSGLSAFQLQGSESEI